MGFVNATPFFETHSVSLEPGEQHVFEINAVVKQRYSYAWTLTLDVVSQGNSQALKLRDTTFRTTGPAAKYDADLVWAWYKHPAQFVSLPARCATDALMRGCE
jgi:hypothetical protein